MVNNYNQFVIILCLIYSIINHFNIGNNKINFIKILNGIYAIIVVIMLGIFYNKGSKDPSIFCTKVLDGHLKWNWYEKFDSSFLWELYGI